MSRARTSARRVSAAAVLGAGLLLTPSLALADDWPQFAGQATRSGASGETLSPAVGVAWSQSTGQATRAGAVISEGVLVVVDEQGSARAFAAETGAPLWTTSLGGSDLTATPAAGRGRVVINLGQGHLVCLSLASGAELWRQKARGGPRAALAISGDTLVASQGFPSQTLSAFDVTDGSLRWTVELAQVAYSAPAIGSGLVVVGTNDGRYEARRLSDGGQAWVFPTGGRVYLSAPVIEGDSVYLLPGGEDNRLYRVDVDATKWASDNWTVALSDPSPPGPAWARMGTQISTATPTLSGGRVVCHLRYDYTLDTQQVWYVADTYTSRERVYGVDPVARSVSWTHDLATQTVTNLATVPPYGLCPSPVGFSDGATAYVTLSSSLSAKVEFRRAGDGGAVTSFQRGAGERWASASSPALANTLQAWVTSAGVVDVRALGGNRPPAAPAPAIASGTVFDLDPRPTLRWTAPADPDDAPAALGYEVRIDDDGEVLLDADFSATLAPGTTSWEVSGDLLSDRTYTWRVRARDPKGALSPWSAAATLEVSLVPQPPQNLVGNADRTSVELVWDASASDYVTGYLVAYRLTGSSAFSTPLDVGAVLRHRIEGLEETRSYDFRVWSKTRLGKQSTPAEISATPQPQVRVNGAAVASLVEALRQAKRGQLISLAAGTFRLRGTVSIPPGVRLRGAGRLSRIQGDPGFPVFRIGTRGGQPQVAAAATTGGSATSASEAVELSGLSLHGGQSGIEVNAGNHVTLRNVLIYDVDDGLVVQDASTVEAEFVTVVRAKRGVVAQESSTLKLRHALVNRNEVGLTCASGASVEVSWSSITGNTVRDHEGCQPSATERALEPRFVSVDLRDFRLESDSPTVDAGDPEQTVSGERQPHGGRVNLGAYGDTSEAALSLQVTVASTTPVAGSGGSRSKSDCSLTSDTSEGPQGSLGWLALVLLLLVARRANLRP